MTPKLRGTKLARAAIKRIIEHPKQWNQRSWPLLTSSRCGCFMHHVNKLASLEINDYYKSRMALCISDSDWQALFDYQNTLSDLKRLCRQIFGIKSITLSDGRRIRFNPPSTERDK